MSEARWSLHFAWGRPPYALDLPEIVIGRADACSLQIQDPAASDEHARFIVDDDEQVWLEDLGSGQPTLINGRAIAQRTLLTDGDFIQIGHAVLTLRATAQRPVNASSPDARTVSAAELPDEVRRVLAKRDSAAKNFVVGAAQPSTLATLMMESPLAIQPPEKRTREPQQTVEVNAADILASIRRDPPPPEASPSAAPNAAVTVARAAAGGSGAHATVQMETLQGIGPAEIAAAPTMIAGMPSPVRAPAPAAAAPQQPKELEAAATMLAEAPLRPPRRRGNTQTDITPLPAPLPAPTTSIPDFAPLMRAITASHDVQEDNGFTSTPTRAEKLSSSRNSVETQLNSPAPVISSLATQQLSAVRDPAADALAMQPTALPTQVPPEVAALQASGQKSKSKSKTRGQPVVPAPLPSLPSQAYTPPKKGLFGAFSRALDFFQQMFALGKQERVLMKPMIYNVMIATPIMAALSVLLLFVHGARSSYGVMSLGVTILYFVDYASNALTASLIYDYVTTGKADLASAKARVKHSAQGILIFAAVSALLDVASTYARERRDLVSKILLRILHAIWTTATYVIMPAMIIEGVPFKDAFARSKKLMDHDPTGVGAGVVALSLCTYILAAIVFPVAYTLMQLGSHLHPVLGMMLFFATVNVYWAVSGWLKIAYSTCFYMWARSCEAQGSTDSALAPLPLRHAIDAG